MKLALPSYTKSSEGRRKRLRTSGTCCKKCLTATAGIGKEVKRRADVVGIFPKEASIVRLIGAVLLEQNDAWLQHRQMQIEAMADLAAPAADAEPRQISCAA